jgi:serine O-acetyltransferase
VLGNIVIGENCRIGAGSVVLRDVPGNSTVVGVPGHIVFQNGKRVVIIDPKQINDPLSEALNAVIDRVKELNDRVRELEGRQGADTSYLDGCQKLDCDIEYQI